MARSGGMMVQTASHIARTVGALGMALLGMAANAPVLPVAAAAMQLLYKVRPLSG